MHSPSGDREAQEWGILFTEISFLDEGSVLIAIVRPKKGQNFFSIVLFLSVFFVFGAGRNGIFSGRRGRQPLHFVLKYHGSAKYRRERPPGRPVRAISQLSVLYIFPLSIYYIQNKKNIDLKLKNYNIYINMMKICR